MRVFAVALVGLGAALGYSAPSNMVASKHLHFAADLPAGWHGIVSDSKDVSIGLPPGWVAKDTSNINPQKEARALFGKDPHHAEFEALLACLAAAKTQSNPREVAMVPGTRAAGDRVFPDIPENHWVYEILAQCTKEGLVTGMIDRLIRGNLPPTRGDISDETVFILMRYNSISAQLMPDGRITAEIGPEAPEAPSGRLQYAAKLARLEPNLEKLVVSFKQYMPAFANPEAMLRYLRADKIALEVTVKAAANSQ